MHIPNLFQIQSRVRAAASSGRCHPRTSTGRAALLAGLLLVHLAVPLQAPAVEGLLNLNQASLRELQDLPFVGAARARAIVEYRRTHGPFQTVEELLASETVGPSTYAAIRPYLTVSLPASPDQARSKGKPAMPVDRQSNPAQLKTYRRIMTRPGEIRVLPDEEYFDTFIHYLRSAEKSIDICMFVFKTTTAPGNRPALVAKELIKARKRGVRVRVVLEESGYDGKLTRENQRVARRLRKNGIEVRFDAPSRTTHAKAVVIDQRYTFVGSHNLTHAALAYNHEFSLLVDSRPLALELIDYMTGLH